jgi:hypothetical protein
MKHYIITCSMSRLAMVVTFRGFLKGHVSRKLAVTTKRYFSILQLFQKKIKIFEIISKLILMHNLTRILICFFLFSKSRILAVLPISVLFMYVLLLYFIPTQPKIWFNGYLL